MNSSIEVSASVVDAALGTSAPVPVFHRYFGTTAEEVAAAACTMLR